MMIDNLKSHISFTSCKATEKICEHLFKNTPIKIFEYSRIYPNGARFELSNHPEHLMNAFITRAKMSNVYTPALIPNDQRYLMITPWIQNMHSNSKKQLEEQLVSQHNLFNIGNEFCIVKKHKEYTVIFHFYADKNIVGLENYYLNNLSTFEQFALYFVDKANLFTKFAKSNCIIKPWINDNKRQIIHTPENSSNINFINEIKLSKFHFNVNGIEMYYTKRELDCALQLMKGKTNKEIAHTLKMSHRTVETHMKSLYAKAEISNRSELISFLVKNGFLNILQNID